MLIQCYHYKTVRVRHRNGYSSRRVRVNTHVARHDFEFTNWDDKSPPLATLNFLDVLKMCRLDILRTFDYSPRTLKRYEKEKTIFISLNKRDTHYDFECHEETQLDCEPHSLAYSCHDGKLPWFVNKKTLCALDCFILGWI